MVLRLGNGQLSIHLCCVILDLCLIADTRLSLLVEGACKKVVVDLLCLAETILSSNQYNLQLPLQVCKMRGERDVMWCYSHLMSLPEHIWQGELNMTLILDEVDLSQLPRFMPPEWLPHFLHKQNTCMAVLPVQVDVVNAWRSLPLPSAIVCLM